MPPQPWLTEQFEASRGHLRAVAYRMLGSLGEAEDAVQEAWLRLNRSDMSEVENVAGWLTTVVARVCLDVLRTRKSRREEELDEQLPTPNPTTHIDPEREALLAESVGLALLVVMERLTPAERLAFVLHDMFAISFEDIAEILGRTPMATPSACQSRPPPRAGRRCCVQNRLVSTKIGGRSLSVSSASRRRTGHPRRPRS